MMNPAPPPPPPPPPNPNPNPNAPADDTSRKRKQRQQQQQQKQKTSIIICDPETTQDRFRRLVERYTVYRPDDSPSSSDIDSDDDEDTNIQDAFPQGQGERIVREVPVHQQVNVAVAGDQMQGNEQQCSTDEEYPQLDDDDQEPPATTTTTPTPSPPPTHALFDQFT